MVLIVIDLQLISGNRFSIHTMSRKQIFTFFPYRTRCAEKIHMKIMKRMIKKKLNKNDKAIYEYFPIKFDYVCI